MPLHGLCVALVLSITSAHAYVPPSFFVIRTLARKHTSLEDAKFRSKVTFFKKGGEVAHILTESLVITSAEHAVVRIVDPSGNELASHTRKLVSGRAGDLDRPVPYDLLFIKDGGNIYEHLRALGLPLKTEGALYSDKEGSMPYKPEPYVSLERFENKVAVVVGEHPKRSDAPPAGTSLWVEKDSFLPLRAIFPSSPESGMASEPLDFRMSSYTMFKSFLYPRTLAVYRGGALWAKIETQDVRASGGSPEENRPKADPDSDIKEYLDVYLKWIR